MDRSEWDGGRRIDPNERLGRIGGLASLVILIRRTLLNGGECEWVVVGGWKLTRRPVRLTGSCSRAFLLSRSRALGII